MASIPSSPRPSTQPRVNTPSGWFGLGQLNGRAFTVTKAVLFAVCLLPFVRWVVLAFTSGFGTNPVEFIIRSTGTWTLVALLVALAVTPVRKLTGWHWLARLRRMFGLFAFFYVCLHFTSYAWIDQMFDLSTIIKDILKRPFITVGFAAFVLLIPLALTSTNAMAKRLGGQRWQLLHKSVYLIGILAIVHYWWHKAGKNATDEVVPYLVVLVLLLGYRLWSYLRQRKQ